MTNQIGWKSGSKVVNLKAGSQEASILDHFAIGDFGDLPVESLCDEHSRLDLRSNEEETIWWRLAGRSYAVPIQEQRVAADGALKGQSPPDIADRLRRLYNGSERSTPRLDEARIRSKAQAGLRGGYVELVLSQGAPALEDLETAEALRSTLASRMEAPPPEIHVVHNLCHKAFAHDPVAPALVAVQAHRLLARRMAGLREVNIGLAGGTHCASLARMTGASSSPFPEGEEPERVRFVPLTLEPFLNHKLPLARAVVGDMTLRAGDLLDAESVEGLTIEPFGYLVDGRFEEDHSNAIVMVRELFRQLHIAVFGIGDRVHDGWLSEALAHVRIEAPERPVTDVCLNLLSARGRPIPLPGGRQFVGVSLADIARLAQREDRTALLLTSGKAKGLPLRIVAGAGYADTVVCDQAAASEALKVLEKE